MNKKKSLATTLKRQWQYHAMMIPGVILTFIFCYIPMYGVIIAFEDFNVGMGFRSPWVGMQNFIYLFLQKYFTKGLTIGSVKG